MKDFYYILGLDPICSLDEIKEAYRKLSKKLHPDLNQGDEYYENRFRDIKEAFETLRDPLKRRVYDEQLSHFRENAELLKERTAAAYAASSARPVWRTARRPKIKKRGSGFVTLTVVLLGAILGVYAANSLFSAKVKKHLPVKDTVARVAVVHKKNHHRHKGKPGKSIKPAEEHTDTTNTFAVKSKAAVLKPEPIQPLAQALPPVKSTKVKAEPLRPMIAKTWPDSDKTHSDYLYTTLIHSNVTGVVPLREQNRYNSSIIASIPGNAKVYVLERGDSYYRVFYEHNIGFVPKWALRQK